MPSLFRRSLPVLLLLALARPVAAAEAPRVVASILPVHGLVAGVMEGVATPTLLVPPGASPHATTLTPSDAAALSAADLVVWVGPPLETFLPTILEARAAKARVLTLMEADGTVRLAQRQGALWTHEAAGDHAAEDAASEPPDAHDHDDHDDHDAHGHEAAAPGAIDPHLWLDPRNAIAWTRAIAAALATVDPAHAGAYRANATARIADLQALDREMETALAPVADAPFLVFHDGYQYLEVRYGLTAVGALALHAGQSPGARHLAEVRHRIAETGARCLFGEPQFSDRLARKVAEGTSARVAILDPLGRDEARGTEHYRALMLALAADLTACLKAD